MNAHNIVSLGTNVYNSSVSESGAAKQQYKESTNFQDYLSSNLKSANYNSEKDTIGNSTKSEKLVKSKLVSNNNILDKKVDSTKGSELDAKVDKLANQMKDTIKETLDLDDKELEQIMSQLGLTLQGLLNPENLKLVCLEASGESDVLALLTNGDLSNQLSTLLDSLNEMNELGISEEELQSLLSDYMKDNEEAHGITSYDNQDTVPKVQTEEQAVLTTVNDLITDEEEGLPVLKDVKVVIEKEGEQSLYHNKSLATSNTSNENLAQHDLNQGQDSRLGMNQLHNETEASKVDSDNEPIGDQFLNQLVQTTVSNVEVVNGQLTTVTEIRDILNQIVNEIRVNISPGNTNMELQLNPDNLGKVNLSIVSKEGIMTAHFTVENAIAKETIESQIHMLKENLTNQGVKVESIEVTVSNFSFAESNQTFESHQEQKSGHRTLKLDGFDDDIIGQDSNVIEELMQEYGNTVDYTA